MALRDFTEDTRKRLINQIDSIKNNQWSWLTDKLGDAWLYIKKWTHFLALEDDMSNVKAYHNDVLDMTNMSKKKLNEIFNKVKEIDAREKTKVTNLAERQNSYVERLNVLTSMIKPGFVIPKASEIKTLIRKYNDDLIIKDKAIQKEFNNTIKEAEHLVRIKSLKNFMFSMVGATLDVLLEPVEMIKDLATGNYLGIVSDTWHLINDVFAVGGTAFGVFCTCIMSPIVSWVGNDKQRSMMLDYSDAYSEIDGLASVCDAEERLNGEDETYHFIGKVARSIDTLDAGYNIVHTGKNLITKPKVVDTKFGFKTTETIKQKEIVGYWYLKAAEKKDISKKELVDIYKKTVKNTRYVDFYNIKKGYGYLETVKDITEGDINIEAPIKKGIESFVPAAKEINDLFEYAKKDFPENFEKVYLDNIE